MTDSDMAFELHFEELGRCGRFARVAGLCGELEIMGGGEARDLIRLEDGELEGELLRWATVQYQWKCPELGNAEIVLLDSRGEPMGSYFFAAAKPIYQYGVADDGQVAELKLVGDLSRRASPEALLVWEMWRAGGPRERNEWASLSFHQRRAWLEVVSGSHSYENGPNHTASTYDLDGRFVTDYPSAFLAIGEAINGPGGYFGRNLDALDDCLCGSFGVDGAFTLRWREMDIARQHLSKEAWRREAAARASSVEEVRQWQTQESLFDALMQVFAEHEIHVISA